GGAGADDDTPRLRLDADDVERLRRAADADALALAHREIDDAVVAAQYLAREVDDIAGVAGLGAQAFDDAGLVAAGRDADVHALRLCRHREAQSLGVGAGFGFGHAAERETQELKLFARGGEQEIALVLAGVGGAVQFGAAVARDA